MASQQAPTPETVQTTADLFPRHGEECDRYTERWRAGDHSVRHAIVEELARLTPPHAASLA